MLGFVLIFFMFVGLTVVATLTFASTLMQNRPPINERNARVEAVRSGMRMAIQFQRDYGVGDCFQDTQSFTFNAGKPEEATANGPMLDRTGRGVEQQLLPRGWRRLCTRVHDARRVVPLDLGFGKPGEPAMKVIEGNVFVGGGDVEQCAAAADGQRASTCSSATRPAGRRARSSAPGSTGPRYENGVSPVDM